ncbi:MAG TPA: hypothetical protein EYP57_04885 [Thermodesulfobacteriaceae bacterium]|nr:hypothetical protein [Thermodesulfobacteriaceae bacterium]
MCLEIRKTCSCGSRSVQFHMRDNILSEEVLLDLYCPACSESVTLNPKNMIDDNGWIIEYDMDLARFLMVSKLQVTADMVSPEYLFDSGYATWQEMYPGEHEEIREERNEIITMLKTDPARYLQEISRWNIARVQRLKADGWRKAQAA